MAIGPELLSRQVQNIEDFVYQPCSTLVSNILFPEENEIAGDEDAENSILPGGVLCCFPEISGGRAGSINCPVISLKATKCLGLGDGRA